MKSLGNVAKRRIASSQGGVAEFPYYPRAFLAPNGRVFYAGEHRRTVYLNTSGSGSWSRVGDRLYGTRDYGAAVMYDVGKILYVGGGRTTNTAEIIDLTPAVTRLAVDRLDGSSPAAP